MVPDCLFCKIVAGEIPCRKVYEDEQILAFHDVNPQAPLHILIIPKQHIPSADHIDSQNAQLVAHIFAAIPQLGEQLGLDQGYRIVNNCGHNGQQTVPHLHFHLLGGRLLTWPPG